MTSIVKPDTEDHVLDEEAEANFDVSDVRHETAEHYDDSVDEDEMDTQEAISNGQETPGETRRHRGNLVHPF